jgi:hypothetical protein
LPADTQNAIRAGDETFMRLSTRANIDAKTAWPFAGEAHAAPSADSDAKGVTPRRLWFLRQDEARGTDTYHKPAKIHAKWDGMTATERAAICPDSPNKIDKDTVASDILRARIARDGNKPAKSKRKP